MRSTKTVSWCAAGTMVLGVQFGCGEESTPTEPPARTTASAPATAPAPARPASVAPALTFSSRVIELGDVADYETREGIATFRNTGTAPLRISNVAPTCGCTSVGFDTSRLYGPGESGEIVFKFTPKGSGRQSKIVRIASNDPKQRVQNVTIKANVLGSIRAEPRILAADRIPLGERTELSTLVTALRPNITLDTATISGKIAPYVQMRLEPAGLNAVERETWRVTADLSDDIPWGWQNGNVTIKGTLVDDQGVSNPITMNMAVNGNVSGLIEPSINMIRLGVSQPGDQIEKSITISRTDGEPLKVLGDPIVEGGALGFLRCSASPVDDTQTSWEIKLKGTTPIRVGSLVGNVLLQTDVPGETQIAIRYGGVVQQPRNARP